MSDRAPTFEEKIEFLRRPESWPVPAASVEVIETHLACVFLTDDHAFKIKRPVRYHDVDLTAPESRRRACEREVSTNRRFAPLVYHGIRPLMRCSAGRLALEGEGVAVDWLVEMRRLPRERMLDRLLAGGRVSLGSVRRFVGVLSDVYGRLPPAEDDAIGHRDRLLRLVAGDCRALLEFGEEIPNEQVRQLERAQIHFLNLNLDVIARRVRDGRVVDGHGDLRPEHVCLEEEPTVIDCLEFDGDLRVLDMLSDVTFLALECERLGASDIGALVLAEYGRRTSDVIDPRLVAFYRAQHACARAKLALWHLDDPGPSGPQKWRARARLYWALARAACSLAQAPCRPAQDDNGSGSAGR